MNLDERILEIAREVFDMTEVSLELSQRNCDRWDSLRHLTFASEIEEAFDIELEPEEIAEMTDMHRVIAMVQSKL